MDYLDEFKQYLNNAKTNVKAEKIVRLMIEEVAKNCPIDVLIRLGECIIDCRKIELRNELERN